MECAERPLAAVCYTQSVGRLHIKREKGNKKKEKERKEKECFNNAFPALFKKSVEGEEGH